MGRGKEIILGIDIGGTKIRALTSVGKFFEFKTPKNKKDFEKILKNLPRADKVGIAVAGVVNGTRVKVSPNIKYLKNFDFKTLKLGKIKVVNDARAFLKAEAGNSKNIMGFTIGTGIGRAFTENASKHLESPESWEREYQKIRDKKNYDNLADYLVEKLNPILKKYKAEKVILGGGVMDKKGFYEKLSKSLNVKATRAKFGSRAGAIGATMLWR